MTNFGYEKNKIAALGIAAAPSATSTAALGAAITLPTPTLSNFTDSGGGAYSLSNNSGTITWTGVTVTSGQVIRLSWSGTRTPTGIANAFFVSVTSSPTYVAHTGGADVNYVDIFVLSSGSKTITLTAPSGTTANVSGFSLNVINQTVASLDSSNAYKLRIYGNHSIAIGTGSQVVSRSATGKNTSLGAQALWGVTEGYMNVAIGNSAGLGITNGLHNIAIGDSALYRCGAGWSNVAVGINSMKALENGSSSNTGVGTNTLFSLANGKNNTAIGNSANSDATIVDNSTSVGYNTKSSHNGSVAIGVDSSGASAQSTGVNDFVLGTSNHTVRVPGTLQGYISLASFKSVVAASTDFADFKTRVAAL